VVEKRTLAKPSIWKNNFQAVVILKVSNYFQEANDGKAATR
jgi:hypothetical protein